MLWCKGNRALILYCSGAPKTENALRVCSPPAHRLYGIFRKERRIVMEEKTTAKKTMLDRILDSIERAGNKLPDPITLFLGLSIIVVLIIALCSALGV